MMLIFMSYFLFPKISSLTCPILIRLDLSLLSISQMKHPTTVHHSSTVISPFWMVGPLTPFFSFSSLIRMTLLSCFLWKFRRMRFSGWKRSFSVRQSDLSFLLSWRPEVVPVGTGTEDSRICVCLSN